MKKLLSKLGIILWIGFFLIPSHSKAQLFQIPFGNDNNLFSFNSTNYSSFLNNVYSLSTHGWKSSWPGGFSYKYTLPYTSFSYNMPSNSLFGTINYNQTLPFINQSNTVFNTFIPGWSSSQGGYSNYIGNIYTPRASSWISSGPIWQPIPNPLPWPVPWPQPTPKPKKSRLTYSVETDKSIYDQAEAVMITFKIKNEGNGTVTLNFDSGQQSEIIIKDKDKNIVWRLSNNRTYIQAQTTITINAGDTKTFIEQWDQTDDNGSPVPLGSYLIEAALTSTSNEYNKAAYCHIGLRTLPTFISCQELKEKLEELRTPVYTPSYKPILWPSTWFGGFGFSGYGYGSMYGSVYSMYNSLSPTSSTGSGTTSYEYSTTNTQVAGVDEADEVKNDSSYLYMIKGKSVRIVQIYPDPANNMTEKDMIIFNNSPPMCINCFYSAFFWANSISPVIFISKTTSWPS